MKIRSLYWKLSCDIHNNIVEPLSRWHDSHKKTHYECCVCGMLEAPYFYDKFKGSMRWDYGWHKLDGGKRWICHRCADHGYSTHTCCESSFEDWYENFVMPNRVRVRELIKSKDPEYYDNCFFYDDEECVREFYEDDEEDDK